ncbi:hypothetical protein K438DRAFT_1967027 [Mycena galopus ATCC 62051]|nr:hypothetical protein K438DRAFT_1967027 [Mycena galopus ATCC 62051]
MAVCDLIFYRRFDIFGLLLLAPNVVETIFSGITDFANRSEDLVVPALRRLIFRLGPRDNEAILNSLTLPALEALSLPTNAVSFGELRSSLKRSAPRLRDLVMGWDDNTTAFVLLQECLQCIPSPARFTMSLPDPPVLPDFSVALTDSPSLLPDLSSLPITLAEPAINDLVWRALARKFSIRRIHLHFQVAHSYADVTVSRELC